MLENIDKAVGNFINILSGSMPEVSKTAKDLVENTLNYFSEVNCFKVFFDPISSLLLLCFGIIIIFISKKMSDADNEAFIPVGIVGSLLATFGILCVFFSIDALPKKIAACKNPKGALTYEFIIGKENGCNKN